MVSESEETYNIVMKALNTYDGVERMGRILLQIEPELAGVRADIAGGAMLAQYAKQVLETKPDKQLWKTMHSAAFDHAIVEFRRTGKEGGWSLVRADLLEIGIAEGWADEVQQALAGQSTESLNRGVTFVENELKKSQSGCYIATAVYGSYDCPQVWVLRRFRDRSLATTRPGRLAIAAYYATSPTIVRLLGGQSWFTVSTRSVLDALVASLRRAGYAQTPYSDPARNV